LAKSPFEDWLQTLAAAVVATVLPLAAGAAVRVLGTVILRAFAAGEPGEPFERVATIAASSLVLMSGPVCVFLWARWAARITAGSPRIRGSIVGLGPGVLMALLILRGGAFRSALAALPRLVAVSFVLAWALVHLAAGIAAGVLTQRRVGSQPR
jgi:hypothetical protein